MHITDPAVKERAIKILRAQDKPYRRGTYVDPFDESKCCAGGAIGLAAGLTDPTSTTSCKASGIADFELRELIRFNDDLNHTQEDIINYVIQYL